MPHMKIVNRYPFEFYDSQLLAYLTEQNELLLPWHELCDALGLKVPAETRRIRRDVVLGDALVVISEPPVSAKVGKARKLAFLPLRLLPYWVGTINTARMEPELKERIIRFKRQFVDVAWAAFRSQVFPIHVWTMADKPFPLKEWE